MTAYALARVALLLAGSLPEPDPAELCYQRAALHWRLAEDAQLPDSHPDAAYERVLETCD